MNCAMKNKEQSSQFAAMQHQYLTDPQLNKGLAFNDDERQTFKLQGRLPFSVRTQKEQVAICLENLKIYTSPLQKYVYLMGLHDRNERLFYRLLSENVYDLMPLVYTPTVGEACQKYSMLFQKPKGMYITIRDKGRIIDLLRNWPADDVKAIVVTDGERILGLGDLGANGMGIPVGKLALYTALAGVKPSQCLPITLDVGTNTESLLNCDHYIGLKQKRVRGEEYDAFIEEFMNAVADHFGIHTLIQFEDFGNQNAFRLLEKYQEKYCTFNDDIQGTASVALAGLLSSLKITGKRLSDNTILFQGAGEASLGIANLCVMAMLEEGTSLEDARSKIYLVDSKGLIVRNRPEGGVNEHKALYAKNMPPIRHLEEVVLKVKPSMLIGAAAIAGAFTKPILEAMAEFNERPVVFALSNPTSKAECTAEEAYKHTKGRAIFASGSPFDPIDYNGKKYYPGQGNNSYIFPGVGLAAVSAKILPISEQCFLIAAKALSKLVTQQDLDNGTLYPPLEKIRECSLKIAVELTEFAYKTNAANVKPKPSNIQQFIEGNIYDYNY